MDEWTDLDQAYLEIFGEHPDVEALIESVEVDPKHDAIGKFISACVKLEVGLDIAASGISSRSYRDVERANVKDKLDILKNASAFIGPGALADRLASLTDAAGLVFDFRNAVVHGVHWGDESGGVLSQRPNRRADGPGQVSVQFDRHTLLRNGARANQLWRCLWHDWQLVEKAKPEPDD